MFLNCNSANPKLNSADTAGIVIFIVGLLCEIVGDLQKDAFRSDAKNKHDFMQSGLWKYSRHPNFFGEIALWWGLFIMCTPVFDETKTWGYATIASPILTMIILLFLSGMPTAEGDNQRRFLTSPELKSRFLAYRESTSPLIPMPPALYKPIPMFIKRLFLFEFKFTTEIGD